MERPNGFKKIMELRDCVLATRKGLVAHVALLETSKSNHASSEVSLDLNTLKMQLRSMKGDKKRVDALSDALKDVLAKECEKNLKLSRVTTKSHEELLLRIKKYSDSVHPMKTMEDLKTRLGRNRRMFGLFHPSMPLDPLVFIEIALTNDISSKVEQVLGKDSSKESEKTNAIFYAITSTQQSLSGIDLGQKLIYRVKEEISKSFPGVKTYCTFSPVPSFSLWLSEKLSASQKSMSIIFEDKEVAKVVIEAHNSIFKKNSKISPFKALSEILQTPEWFKSKQTCQAIERPLNLALERYLTREKTTSSRSNKKTAIPRIQDPVAHFHYSNGASLYRVNFLSDESPKRMSQSHGMMANYIYDTNLAIARQNYTQTGQVSVYKPKL